MTSAIGDSQVLRSTTYSEPDEKGRRQLKFTLPSGRLITSTDWLVPGEVKGKVLIAWADAIRAEDQFDIQEQEERERLAHVERRARELTSSAPTECPVPAQIPISAGQTYGLGGSSAETSKASSTLSLPDDPRSVIADKLAELRISAAEAESRRDSALEALETAHAAITRWEAVLSSIEQADNDRRGAVPPPSERTLHLPRTPRQQRKARKAEGQIDFVEEQQQ